MGQAHRPQGTLGRRTDRRPGLTGGHLTERTCPICNLRPVNQDADTCGGECGYELRRRRYYAEKERRKAGLDLPAQPSIGIQYSYPEFMASKPASPPPSITFAEVPLEPIPAYRRIVCWPDTHLPFADPKAVSLALKIVEYVKPDLLVCLGDMVDMAGFSRFGRNLTDPRSYLQNELEEWFSLARALRDAAPNAEKIYLRGNHEARLEKWCWGHPQLTGFNGFELGELLKLRDFGFRPNVEEEVDYCKGTLTLRHGTFIGGNYAGTAARQEMSRAGTSGCSGHTHRAGKYIQRDKTGLRMWIESGHLALNPPHYAHTVQNWCQAITIGEISTEGNDFDLEVVPFRLSYKARVHGREFSA